MNKLPFTTYPFLETERLVLRKIDKDKDLGDFFVLRSDAEVMKYIPRPVATEYHEVVDLINAGNEGYERGEMLSLAIVLKEIDTFIGVVGFYRINWENHRTEIGYILNPLHSGKGYVHEACNALIKFAFNEVGLNALDAVIEIENKKSMLVVERLGFIRGAVETEMQSSENLQDVTEPKKIYTYTLKNPLV
jgi:[ribosomal protein S5]-alanine N-acetyltransferase